MKMNEESKINVESEKQHLQKLQEAAKKAAEKMSENYKQKLVYSLLNALKAGDQSEFFWILLRAINDPKNDEFREFANKIKEVYGQPAHSFEKWGYGIVLGIMAAGKGGE